MLVVESKDISKKEQLSDASRYVDNEAVVQEHFLIFTEAKTCTAEADTRWVCRYAAVSAICYTYDSILLTMEDVMDSPDRVKAMEAKCLYHQIKSFSF